MSWYVCLFYKRLACSEYSRSNLQGLYGFDVRGPATFPMLQMHYWSNVLRVLRKTIGAEVIVTGVPG